jgi:hypothetical protein
MKLAQRSSSINTSNLNDHLNLKNSFSFHNISEIVNESELDSWPKIKILFEIVAFQLLNHFIIFISQCYFLLQLLRRFFEGLMRFNRILFPR